MSETVAVTKLDDGNFCIEIPKMIIEKFGIKENDLVDLSYESSDALVLKFKNRKTKIKREALGQNISIRIPSQEEFDLVNDEIAKLFYDDDSIV